MVMVMDLIVMMLILTHYLHYMYNFTSHQVSICTIFCTNQEQIFVLFVILTSCGVVIVSPPTEYQMTKCAVVRLFP